jgi:hypothetical protein
MTTTLFSAKTPNGGEVELRECGGTVYLMVLNTLAADPTPQQMAELREALLGWASQEQPAHKDRRLA